MTSGKKNRLAIICARPPSQRVRHIGRAIRFCCSIYPPGNTTVFDVQHSIRHKRGESDPNGNIRKQLMAG